MKSTSITRKSSPSRWSEILAEIVRVWPTARWRDVGVIVGCSGGADSIALLKGLAELRRRPNADTHYSAHTDHDADANHSADANHDAQPPRGFLVAAHFNHGLRGSESEADEAFVRDFAEGHHLDFSSGRPAETASDEASMRSQRLEFLVQTAHAAGARYIALAHSLEDNVETVLHNLMRGTGPSGLAGIRSCRPISRDLVLVRPLLGTGRDRIRAALTEADQPWREDSSNTNTDYRRNWIRHELVPQIESQYPNAVIAVGRAIESQRDWRTIIDRIASEWIDTHCSFGTVVSLRRDRETELPILVAALQSIWEVQQWPRGEMTREHWLRIAGTLASNRTERYSLPGNIDAVAQGDEVKIRAPGVEVPRK